LVLPSSTSLSVLIIPFLLDIFQEIGKSEQVRY